MDAGDAMDEDVTIDCCDSAATGASAFMLVALSGSADAVGDGTGGMACAG